MIAEASVLRVLDPSERFFWLSDQVATMNLVTGAVLDRRLEPEIISAALRAVQRVHPWTRARIEIVDKQPIFVEVTGEIPLEVRTVGGADWLAEVEVEFGRPFDPSPAPEARCIYLPIEGVDTSVLLMIQPHAMADGRASSRLIQQVLRAIAHDGDNLPARPPGPVPPLLHDHFPAEFRSPRTALDVLQAIRGERQGIGEPPLVPFHARHQEAWVPRYQILVGEPGGLSGLVDQARAAGATVSGALAAIALESLASLFDESGERTLYLGTPVDLSQRVEPPLPADTVVCAVGMLCTPYRVSTPDEPDPEHPGPADPALARTITEQFRRELNRGESHLFFRFARIAAFPASDEGIRSFADQIDRSPQNLMFTNVGTLDDPDDPPGIRFIFSTVAPQPNQIALVTFFTYRGRYLVSVSSDRAKLSDAAADKFLAQLAARTGTRRVSDAGFVRPADSPEMG
ncbi:MAG TPA: hypothetical protein VGG43_00065 [Acidimicrobiales bacterium]|jgi:hypothetical protein